MKKLPRFVCLFVCFPANVRHYRGKHSLSKEISTYIKKKTGMFMLTSKYMYNIRSKSTKIK